MEEFFSKNISWLFTALSIWGNIHVIKKQKVGQLLWMLANVGWIWYNVKNHEWAAATLFSIYLGLCIWGFVQWHLDEKKAC
ncbi:MAG: hypothetical protein JW769_04900 [Parachlamydiales bacterium]|nr:hypothetical protein [Parachlamydiales bacterium]